MIHKRGSEVIRLFLSAISDRTKKISYHIKPGIAGNIIDTFLIGIDGIGGPLEGPPWTF